MIQNLFRYTCPTVAVMNAGGGVPDIDAILRKSAGSSPQLLVGLNALAGTMQHSALVTWLAGATRTLQSHGSKLLLLGGDAALAGGRTLPRSPGVTSINEQIAVVTRVWTFRDAKDHPALTLVGPIAVPRLARFLGSTWTHDLVSPEDLSLVAPVPMLIMDSPLPARASLVHSHGRSHPSDQFAWTILDQTNPLAAWVRGTEGDPHFRSHVAIHHVHPGDVSTVEPPRV